MPTQQATALLEREHHYIQKAAGIMIVLAERLESGQPVAVPWLRDLLEFIRTFGDRCHHGKEDDCLFPLLVKKGVPVQGCPIGGLRHEHDAGRALVKQLGADTDGYAHGDPAARAALAQGLRALAGLYPNHIWKEDYLLFPLTNKLLNAKDQQALLKKFAQADKRLGAQELRRLVRLIETLERATTAGTRRRVPRCKPRPDAACGCHGPAAASRH